ncbi:MAG TPA: S8 family serine peptidase, partial [Candidatus Polarisedimenticolia bacterium]|nr:S8 family serine peptidase [Candidatus Polarisedimenticolia bacterium]
MLNGVLAAILVLSASGVLAQPSGRGRPPELRLAAGTFRPLDAAGAAPGWYHPDPRPFSPLGRRYLVAVADTPLGPPQLRLLQESGAEILGYLPHGGYRVRLQAGFEPHVRALPFVVWLGALPGHFKAHAEVASIAGRADAGTRLRVVLEPGEPPERALSAIHSLQLEQVRSHPSGKDGAWRLEATVPAGRVGRAVSRLAGLPEVEWIEPARPMSWLNQDAVWVHQSFSGPSPQQTPIFDRGIFGCGQTLAISDSGQDFDLCFFSDPNGATPVALCNAAPCPPAAPNPTRRKDTIYFNWSGTPTGDDDLCPGFFGASGHGTHTSGSAVGDAPPYADCTGFTTPGRNGGDGQAPGAKLVMQEMGDGLEYLNLLGGSVWNLSDVAYLSGARIHSNSWGGACTDALGTCVPGCTIPYDSFARDADLAMWTHPDLLLVFSTGNAGGICPAPHAVSTPGTAKNVVAAGSVGHGAAASSPSAFSSEGPVFDGRLKPTVMAQGEAVVSAGSDSNPLTGNCTSCSLDGTSMSAPTTAGLAALAREYYTAGFLAAGIRSPADGFVPSAALLKATVIDAAIPIGASSPGPDFKSGFGRIRLDGTLAFAGGGFQLRADDHREGLLTGGIVQHAYDVASGTPFRATLVWTDYPAALGAATARVNELKLEVVDPDGNVWFQTIDPGTGLPVQTMNPADPHDSVNVEERIVLPSPAAGRYIVRVHGVTVPMGPQPFALVVRGALSDCPAPAQPGPVSLASPGPNQIEVSWPPAAGAAAYNIYRSLGACPGGPWTPVALGTTATSVFDIGVSGGATYSYQVAAASDVEAACESARSDCAQVVPTGDCFLAPLFGGIAAAVSAGTAGCTIDLEWTAATPQCTGDVVYNIYRDTSAGFAPGPASRIAACVTATTYSDSAELVHGTTYHYIVRAEDATSGHSGPCRGGNEEANTAIGSAAPDGPAGLGTFRDDAGDTGAASFTTGGVWSMDPAGGNTGPQVYTGTSGSGVCGALTSPVLTLGSPALGPQLSFSTIHDLEYDPDGFFGAGGSLGQVEIATGPTFTNWTRVPLTPGYPALITFPFNNCASTQSLTGYFSGTDLTWSTYTASLANWAGGDVRIRYQLSGDLLYPSGQWWIDDVEITQAITAGSC